MDLWYTDEQLELLTGFRASAAHQEELIRRLDALEAPVPPGSDRR
jgi:hypothetical protein